MLGFDEFEVRGEGAEGLVEADAECDGEEGSGDEGEEFPGLGGETLPASAGS